MLLGPQRDVVEALRARPLAHEETQHCILSWNTLDSEAVKVGTLPDVVETVRLESCEGVKYGQQKCTLLYNSGR